MHAVQRHLCGRIAGAAVEGVVPGDTLGRGGLGRRVVAGS